MTTKHSLYIVTIHGTEHAVRATGKRAAEADAIADRISTRKATDDDIIRIVRSQARIIGDMTPDADEAQSGLFAGEPDPVDQAVDNFNYDKSDGEHVITSRE